MQRIKNIEFLRVIGCIAIILCHMFTNKARLYGMFGDIDLYSYMYTLTKNGNKAVDLFFILSGVFFAMKLDTSKSLWKFIKHKLIRLYPVLLFIAGCYFICSLFGIVKFDYYNNIFALLCLNGTGLAMDSGNLGISWYVSTLLWVLGIYFYLFKHFAKEKVNLIICLIVLLSYCFLIHVNKGLIGANFTVYKYIFSTAMLRGLAGIGVGYFIGEFYKNNAEKIRNLCLSVKSKLLITGLEIFSVAFIIINLMFHKLGFNNQLIFIVAFAVSIVCFLCRQGYLSQILENDFWGILSKYTYSLYMTHSLVMNLMKGTVWKHYPELVYAHPVANVWITFLFVLIFGICTYHFIEKPCARYLKKKFAAG